MKKELILQNINNTSLKWQQPMLATLTYNFFSDPNWIYEAKLDGERCLAYCDGKGNITLYSRNHIILNNIYPEILQSLTNSRHKSFIIDGEIIAFDKRGLTSFSKLQERIGIENPTTEDIANTPVYYFIFDISYFNGLDLRKVPLIERKNILKNNIIFHQHLIYCKHYKKYGIKFYKIACKKRCEGIIAKDAFSYYENNRSKKWLKFKCGLEQEFIIIGYTDPGGSRIGLGALLLGYYEKNILKYAGKVGTGFNQKTLKLLKDKLTMLETSIPNIGSKIIRQKHIHWVKPELVCEVKFFEWTNDNKLRHPTYKGIRMDKSAYEVIKETI